MRFLIFLLTFTLVTVSCKQKTVENPEKKDFSKEVDAICSCVKSYREFEEKREMLKFTNTNVNLINDVVALEIQMNECLVGQQETYKKLQSDLNPLLEKKCPPALKLMK
jgi:hypothetical protein